MFFCMGVARNRMQASRLGPPGPSGSLSRHDRRESRKVFSSKVTRVRHQCASALMKCPDESAQHITFSICMQSALYTRICIEIYIENISSDHRTGVRLFVNVRWCRAIAVLLLLLLLLLLSMMMMVLPIFVRRNSIITTTTNTTKDD